MHLAYTVTMFAYHKIGPQDSDLGCSSELDLSKTKSVTPIFFNFLAKVDHYLSAWQVLKKIVCGEQLGRERPYFPVTSLLW